ncbi:MAG: hypothetical protein RH982_05470 [Parvibaculum sp.]
MIRLFLPAAALAFGATLWAAPAGASCETGGLLDTCVDGGPAAAADGEEEVYERLDGGGYGGRPEGGPQGQTITIGGTTVTLSQTEEDDSQPWQAFNQKTGDEQSAAREDRAKDANGTLDPLKTQCYADGCY